MAIEPKIVVGRKIRKQAAVDLRRRACSRFMDAEERVDQADQIGCRALDLQFLHARQRREVGGLLEGVWLALPVTCDLTLGFHAPCDDILQRSAAGLLEPCAVSLHTTWNLGFSNVPSMHAEIDDRLSSVTQFRCRSRCCLATSMMLRDPTVVSRQQRSTKSWRDGMLRRKKRRFRLAYGGDGRAGRPAADAWTS